MRHEATLTLTNKTYTEDDKYPPAVTVYSQTVIFSDMHKEGQITCEFLSEKFKDFVALQGVVNGKPERA